MTTFGTAKWQGGLKDGKGWISSKSGALSEQPYGFASRFEGKPGTNPEELIGAAHAGCFTMALSLILEQAGFKADEMNTKAEITLEKQGDGFAITKSHLTLRAKIPGIDAAKFKELAGMAEKGCPSQVNAQISLVGTRPLVMWQVAGAVRGPASSTVHVAARPQRRFCTASTTGFAREGSSFPTRLIRFLSNRSL